MESFRGALSGVASELAGKIRRETLLGLGSGSTVTALLGELAPKLLERFGSVDAVPTSTQVEIVAKKAGFRILPFEGSVDLVIDGADQVDRELNMVKGGGGALLREKVLMSSAKEVVVVAAQEKFSARLCENGVRVPVEVVGFARESVKRRLREMGCEAEERLLPKGYPFFTENGNVILEAGFKPIGKPASVESRVKCIPGVVEVGIFTVKPITVYRLRERGRYDVLRG